MAKKKTASPPPPSKLSYEDAIEELERINEQIEDGQIGLEETITAFKRGKALAQRCSEVLDVAEQEVQQIGEEGSDDQGD
jgi:exodeoxyribonuclease VII small subunit